MVDLIQTMLWHIETIRGRALSQLQKQTPLKSDKVEKSQWSHQSVWELHVDVCLQGSLANPLGAKLLACVTPHRAGWLLCVCLCVIIKIADLMETNPGRKILQMQHIQMWWKQPYIANKRQISLWSTSSTTSFVNFDTSFACNNWKQNCSHFRDRTT